MKYTEDAVKRILRTTPDCLTPERLSENLSESERQHVDTCSRCQAELRLWHEYEQGEVSPDEGAAVQWIVAELAPRRNHRPHPPALCGAPRFRFSRARIHATRRRCC